MPHKLPKILNRDQAIALIKRPNPRYPTGLRNKVALLLMYRAGLRVSEVCNLAIADMDLSQGLVQVQQGKGKKDRVVPLDPDTIAWCQKWLDRKPPSKWFICTLDGDQVSDRYLRAMITRYAAKAGITICDGRKEKLPHPHTLRHTYATELLEEGFSIREIQELLGHASVQTTMIYTHVRPEALAEKIRQRAM